MGHQYRRVTIKHMTASASIPDQRSAIAKSKRKWLDLLLAITLGILLVYAVQIFRSARYCAYMGTDFRGYYAAAQIAWQQGFSKVYDQHLQEQYQAALPYRCPDSSNASPLLDVYMPYLPVFVLVTLPLILLDFTTAYYVWVLLNLVGLLFYLLRFARAIGESGHYSQIIKWMLCAALASNLFLGQMNVLLVIFIGEFVLAFIQRRDFSGGFWLGGLLMKPHILILLLPGLFLSRQWKMLLGFATGAAAILGVSLLLGGVQGIWASIQLAVRFAGSLIQTASSMMNFRGLAQNLAQVFPGWLAWAVAIGGMLLVIALVFYLWLHHYPKAAPQFILLILATLAATFAVTWHSHFYLLLLAIPLLLYLDLKRLIPENWVWAWMLFPPAIYIMLYLVNPEQARNWFGLGMLAFDLFIFGWSARQLLSKECISS